MNKHQIYVTYKDMVPAMKFSDDPESITVIIHHDVYTETSDLYTIADNVKAQFREQNPKGTVLAICTRPSMQHKHISLDDAIECVRGLLESKVHWSLWEFDTVNRKMHPTNVNHSVSRDIAREKQREL